MSSTRKNLTKHVSKFLQKIGISNFDTKNRLNMKQIKHYLHLGGQNYMNLEQKVPVLDKQGKPIRLRVGGKVVMEMFEPLFKGGYVPEPNTENMFVNPSFLKNKTSKRQRGVSQRGVSQRGVSQRGGMDLVTIFAIVGIVLGAMQLSNSFSETKTI
jgi:hypothetical protein